MIVDPHRHQANSLYLLLIRLTASQLGWCRTRKALNAAENVCQARLNVLERGSFAFSNVKVGGGEPKFSKVGKSGDLKPRYCFIDSRLTAVTSKGVWIVTHFFLQGSSIKQSKQTIKSNLELNSLHILCEAPSRCWVCILLKVGASYSSLLTAVPAAASMSYLIYSHYELPKTWIYVQNSILNKCTFVYHCSVKGGSW